MAEWGGIGLGLAEPDLRVVYLVAGGAAAHCRGVFDVGDCVVGVDDASVVGLSLKKVSVGTFSIAGFCVCLQAVFCALNAPSSAHSAQALAHSAMHVALNATQFSCGLLTAGAHHWSSRHRRQNHHFKDRDWLDQVQSADSDAARREQHENGESPADPISACMCAGRVTWASERRSSHDMAGRWSRFSV